MRCPNCGDLGDPHIAFKPLDRNADYAHELNVVYKHLKEKGGCGHVFSPGDQQIMIAYLSGELLPRQIVVAQKERIAELEAEVDRLKGRPVLEVASLNGGAPS